jgi:hypothetical protein
MVRNTVPTYPPTDALAIVNVAGGHPPSSQTVTVGVAVKIKSACVDGAMVMLTVAACVRVPGGRGLGTPTPHDKLVAVESKAVKVAV